MFAPNPNFETLIVFLVILTCFALGIAPQAFLRPKNPPRVQKIWPKIRLAGGGVIGALSLYYLLTTLQIHW